LDLIGNDNDSENHKMRNAAAEAMARRSLFVFSYYSRFFSYSLPHSRNRILCIPGWQFRAPTALGLTTLDLNHRAGLVLIERVPRPSSSIEKLQ
jgi:hypothetical protein